MPVWPFSLQLARAVSRCVPDPFGRSIRLLCCSPVFSSLLSSFNVTRRRRSSHRANRDALPVPRELYLVIVMRPVSARTTRFPQHRLAWLVAIAADAIQIVGLPFFVEGVLSPVDTLLDVVVAVILTRLLGWHWSFLPGLVSELIPGLDLFPTWTAAVFYVTSRRVLQDRATK